MSFLAPLFLLAGLAVAAPVWFHLMRRTTRERMRFSSLLFLRATPRHQKERSRLENFLLLMLRCLALILLALAFSRPFLRELAAPASGGDSTRIAVLVDTSASMRRAGLWSDAMRAAEEAIRNAGPADELSLLSFGRATRTILSTAEWNATPRESRVAVATSRLHTLAPTWEGTNLGSALVTAADALAEAASPTATRRQVIVISDLQAGSNLQALQGYEWPKGAAVRLVNLAKPHETNAGLQLLEANDADDAASMAVRVRVSNAADSTREQFTVGWVRAPGGPFVGTPIETYVPPGGTRILSLPASGAQGSQAIALKGDDEDFDNILFAIPPVQQRVSINYIGSESVEDSHQPLFFLRRALGETPRLAVAIANQPPANTPALASGIEGFFVVTEALPAQSLRLLQERVAAGATVLLAPKTASALAQFGPAFGASELSVQEAHPANYAMLAEIDFQHPLFAVFADPRYSDFTKIHFWNYRRISAAALPGARVLAKFDQGDPALLEVPSGKGRWYILTSGWNPADSQLGVSSKFVPWLYAMLESSSAITVPRSQLFVGDDLPLPVGVEAAATITLPGGSNVTVPAGTSKYSATAQPGIYRVTSGSTMQNFVVNLDPAESRTTPLASEELERLGVPLAGAKPAGAEVRPSGPPVASVAAESEQKLWRWFIVGALVVLLGESLVAGWTSRAQAATGGASP